ncbi:MAG TPA: hypothetical protein VF746_05810 [Longimicrobium sp.]|jgi:hypothetical protein
MKRSLVAFACVALAACNAQDATSPLAPAGPANATAGTTAFLNQPFTLRTGQTAVVSGEGLSVRFESVPSDSRCPTGVQCIWAGNAVVRVVLSKDGKAAGFELNTNLEPRTASYLNYEIELLQLDPYPTAKGGAISQSQYRATFVVRKAAVLGQPFDLKAFGTATIAGEGLSIHFDGVNADSRCPSDVTCIWAGDAEVQLTLSKAGFPSQTVVLHTTLDPKSASYAGYTVNLQDLKPYPVSTSTIAPGDYVATLLVTKP